MIRSRRTALKVLGALGFGVAASACAGPPAAPREPAGATPGGQRPVPSFNPVLATSELVVGMNRFALGLIGEGNRPITDAKVDLGFFQISGQQATKRSESEAIFRSLDVAARGMYTARVELDQPGAWGVEVRAARPGREQEVARLSFEVLARGAAPMIGEPAPRSKTATVRDQPASELCSNVPPCELHAASVDEVLGAGKPSVVFFASPGFCTTATCAPTLGVVLQARARHAERISFVHVEVYKDPRNQVVADAVTQWSLPSEPWVFVADRHGLIADRFEGILTLDELEAALPS